MLPGHKLICFWVKIFIKNDFIAKQVKSILEGSSMPVFVQTALPDKNKLSLIFKWLTENGMTADQAKDTLTKIKNSIFQNVKTQNIEDEYSKILEGISFS